MKRCCTCDIQKNENEFYGDKSKPDGLYARCKSCHLSSCAKYRKSNPEVSLEWRKSNREYLLTQKKLDYKKNKLRYDLKNREWAITHKEVLKEYNKIYNIKNRKRIASLAQRYRQKNIDKVRPANIEYQRSKRQALANGYIKALLRRQCSLSSKENHILEKLIELKKTHLKLKRMIYAKQSNDSQSAERKIMECN